MLAIMPTGWELSIVKGGKGIYYCGAASTALFIL